MPPPVVLPTSGAPGPTTAETFALDNRPATPPRRRKRASSGWLLMAVALILGVAVLGIVYLVLTKFSTGIPVAGNPTRPESSLGRHVSKNFNYSYDFPPGWRMDGDTKTAIGSNLFVIRRSGPDAWMTLMAKEYPTTPRDGQMFDEFYRRMEKHFTDLEYEQHPDGQLDGQRALRFVFQGKVKDVGLVVGEAYLMVYQGIGYALLTWSPAEDVPQAAREYDDLRLRFNTQKNRETWVDNRQPGSFQGTKAAYTLRDNQGVWKKNADYMELFKADLALEAIDPTIADARTNTAVILVRVHPKQANLTAAAALARSELVKEHKKDYPATKMEVIAGMAGHLDRDGLVGDQQGHVTKLHVINGANRQRFVVLATAPLAEGTVVFHGECPWERRSLWERDFDQLIATFRLK